MTKTQQVEFYTNMVIAFTDALDSFEERFGDKKLLDFFQPSADAADKYKERKNVMEKESVACFKSFIERQLNKEVPVEYEVIQDLFAEAWVYEDDSLEKFKKSVHEAEYLCSTYVESWSLHVDECREDLLDYSNFLFVLMYSLIDYQSELED